MLFILCHPKNKVISAGYIANNVYPYSFFLFFKIVRKLSVQADGINSQSHVVKV